MKTAQEVLRELDTERLIGTYLYGHPIDYDDRREKLDLKIGFVHNRYKDTLRQYINRLRTISIVPPEDGQKYILYVSRCVKDGISSEATGLILAEELLEKGADCADYGFEFNWQAEIMGFLVADTPLTQRHLYSLMADVMYEAAFFGFEQEALQEEIDTLRQREEEIRSGTAKYHPWKEVEKELEDKFGFHLDRESPDEEALRMKVVEAETAYHLHSRTKELTLIREQLLKKEKGDGACTTDGNG